MTSVLVVGSSNTDMVIRVPTLPRPGETISDGRFATFAGGKGANQSVAACRAGAQVMFIASVGNDELGRAALQGYANEGIDVSAVHTAASDPSGVAMVLVDNAGENSIAVAPGANRCLTPEMLRQQSAAFAAADILLLQLETPMDTVAEAIRIASKAGLKTILNPAPASRLARDLLSGLYCVTPNETEAEAITGIAVNDQEDAITAARKLLDWGVKNVIITLGANGAVLCNETGDFHAAAASVAVVDTTGAGDTFNGVLAAALAAGCTLEKAMDRAVAAASLSVQHAGATTGMPFLDQNGHQVLGKQ